MKILRETEKRLIGGLLVATTIGLTLSATAAHSQEYVAATAEGRVTISLVIPNGALVSRSVAIVDDSNVKADRVSLEESLRTTGKAIVPFCLKANKGTSYEISSLSPILEGRFQPGSGASLAMHYAVGVNDEMSASTEFVAKGRKCTGSDLLNLSIRITRDLSRIENQKASSAIQLFIVPV